MDGWIKLHRQLITNGWLKNHKLFVFWAYCLLKAVHKETKAIFGFQEIPLEPGQFIFGRKKASEETGLSEREIRTCIALLKNAKNATVKTTNKYSIISIVNWHTYQSRPEESDQQPDQQTTSKRPHTRSKECKEEKTPADFSSFLQRYSPEQRELIDQAFKAIAQTRKTGKVSDSILLAQLKSWTKYPPQQVAAGIRTYLEKGYHLEDKREAYLLGIIRNQGSGGTGRREEFKSTGSCLLDAYYRRQEQGAGQ